MLHSTSRTELKILCSKLEPSLHSWHSYELYQHVLQIILERSHTVLRVIRDIFTNTCYVMKDKKKIFASVSVAFLLILGESMMLQVLTPINVI